MDLMMEAMGLTVILMAAVLTLFVAIVLGIGAWSLVRITSALSPIKDMLEKHTMLIDKMVTIIIAKGPLEYSSIRAADSLVSYDGDSSATTDFEEPDHGEEAYRGLGDDSDSLGDPFLDGTWAGDRRD